jgi:predicted transcriptional regulator
MEKRPTDSEIDILTVLWDRGPSTVREVHESLSHQRDVYYTTTLKTMQVMVEKGLVSRDTTKRSHIYFAGIKKEAVEKTLLDKLIGGIFMGSPAKLVISALGLHKPTAKELDDIKSLIDKIDQNALD